MIVIALLNSEFLPDPSRQSLPIIVGAGKPRLVRQSAFHDETQEPSSPRLNVRFPLPTIPSAPDSSVQLDDEPEDQQTVAETPEAVNLQIPADNSTILSSPKSNSKPP